MPSTIGSSPRSLVSLSYHTFVIFFIRKVKELVQISNTDEILFNPPRQESFLEKMSSNLWFLHASSRKHRQINFKSNLNGAILEILNYVDLCTQKAQCGYFCRLDFTKKMDFLTMKLRALLDFENK